MLEFEGLRGKLDGCWVWDCVSQATAWQLGQGWTREGMLMVGNLENKNEGNDPKEKLKTLKVNEYLECIDCKIWYHKLMMLAQTCLPREKPNAEQKCLFRNPIVYQNMLLFFFFNLSPFDSLAVLRPQKLFFGFG